MPGEVHAFVTGANHDRVGRALGSEAKLEQSMAFQSEFADNEKLNKAAVNDADHVGEQFSPKGPWVVLIKKALNAWAAKQRPPVAQVSVGDVFDRQTGDLVALYKTRQAPPILNFAGKIDRIVGKKTVVALDKELPAKGGGSSISPDMQLVNAADGRRLAALIKAEADIRRLKRDFEPNVPDENDPVVQALQRQLFVPMDSNFWTSTNQVLSMIVTNRLQRAAFLIDKTSPSSPTSTNQTTPEKASRSATASSTPTTIVGTRSSRTSSFISSSGSSISTGPTTHAEAMRCPHHLARVVFDIALGQRLAPCSGSGLICR